MSKQSPQPWDATNREQKAELPVTEQNRVQPQRMTALPPSQTKHLQTEAAKTVIVCGLSVCSCVNVHSYSMTAGWNRVTLTLKRSPQDEKACGHCGICLKGKDALMCGKCQTAIYCSRECQVCGTSALLLICVSLCTFVFNVR